MREAARLAYDLLGILGQFLESEINIRDQQIAALKVKLYI